MANLFDGIRKCEKSEIAKLFCDFKIYNIPVMLHMAWQCILYSLMWVYGKIMLLFKKQISLPPVYFWENRYDMLYESCMVMEEEELKQAFLKLLKGRMGMLGLSVKGSEEHVSAQITRAVSPLFSCSHLKGLSILEVGDYICKKYPAKKKPDEKMCLRLWMPVSVFVLFASVICYIAMKDLRMVILPGAILLEMLWGYWVFYKVTQWQLARVMWTASVGLGDSFAVKGKVSVRYPKGQNKESCEREHLVYHTLCFIRDGATAREKKLLLEDLTEAKALCERDKLKYRWENYFRKLEFKESFLSDAINQFSFGDFEKMERRFGELSSSKDPSALARKCKYGYMMDFKTLEGDIGTIYFTGSKKADKRLCICKLERKGRVKLVPMTTGMLYRHMENEDYAVAAAYQEYLKGLLPKEEKLADIECNIKMLEAEKKEREKRKQLKEADILKLRKQISEREKECEDIRNLLAKAGLKDNEYEEQRLLFLKVQRQLTALKENYKHCEKQYEKVSEELDSCISKENVFRKEAEMLKDGIEDIRRLFFAQVKELVQRMRKDNRRDTDYILGELLIRKFGI